MTSRVQTNRSSTTGTRPSNTRPVGELSVNFADNQVSIIDPTPTARDLLPVRFHSATAAYAINAIVQQAAGLYQAKAAIPAHAFSATEWNQFLTAPQGDTRWLPLAGGTLTGLLTLSGPPTANLHAATKLYTDTQDALCLPLTGGVLTGALTLSGPPTVALHAATKAYVDSVVGNYLPLTGGTISGDLTITGGTISGDLTITGGNVIADGGVFVQGGAQPFGLSIASGGSRNLIYSATCAWLWDGATGNLVWSTPVGSMWNLRTSDLLAFNAVGAVGGNGAYVNISDESTKSDITPSPYGLAHVLQLQPILFHRLKPDGMPAERVEIGFAAQQVQPIIPEAVTVAGFPNPDTLAISIDGIVAALVSAVQQLDARVSLLEDP